MLASPLLAVAVCALLYQATVRRFQLERRRALDDLVGRLFFGGVFGAGAGVAFALVAMFVWSANEAPIWMIFTIPSGVALGSVVAAFLWSSSERTAWPCGQPGRPRRSFVGLGGRLP